MEIRLKLDLQSIGKIGTNLILHLGLWATAWQKDFIASFVIFYNKTLYF